MASSLRVMAGMGLVWLCSQVLPAVEPSASQRTSPVGTRATAGAVTDVLEAEKNGLVNVRFIPNDSRSAQIIVTNRSRKPLTLRLPHAFAGVPVAAQMGGMGGGMGGMGGGMPGMGGVAACQQLRMRADYRDCLIIACTAHAGRVELASYAESGFSNTLTKPFLVQQLFAVLQLPHPFA